MPEADGYVRIDTKMDDTSLVKKMAGLAEKINKQTEELSKAKNGVRALREEYAKFIKERTADTEDDVNKQIEVEKINLSQLSKEYEQAIKERERIGHLADSLEETGKPAPYSLTESMEKNGKEISSILEKVREAKETIAALNADLPNVLQTVVSSSDAVAFRDKIAAADEHVQRLSADLSNSKSAMGSLQSPTKNFENSLKRVDKTASNVSARISRMAKTALFFYGFRRFFTYIRDTVSALSGLSAVTGVFTDFNNKIKEAYTNNEQVQASLAKLRGSLYTAFAPIYSVVVPALTSLINWLARAIQYIGAFFAALSGKSLQESAAGANNLAKAVGNVGGAAKSANKQLAAFDKLNTLSGESGGGGGGGEAAAPISFDYDKTGVEEFFGWCEEHLEAIKWLAISVGLALGTWKIVDFLSSLGKVPGAMEKAFGVIFAIAGAVIFIKGFFDAWENGIDWENLAEMVIGAAIAVTALGLAFGATHAAVALLVFGVGIIIVALHDLAEKGELTTEAFTALEIGLVAVAVAFGLLHAPVLANVALFAAAFVAIHHFWDKISGWLLGLADKLEEAGLDGLAGFVRAFVDWGDKIHTWVDEHIVTPFINALKKLFGIHSPSTVMAGIGDNIIQGLWDGIKETWASFLSWIEGKWDNLKSWWQGLSLGAFDFRTPHLQVAWEELGSNNILSRFLGFTKIPHMSIAWYAAGGFPDAGSLFMAGEAGPELVGSFGGHNNTVVNEAQLVQAFRQASAEQVALLQEQNSLLAAILEKSGTVSFKPSVAAGKVFSQSIGLYNRAMG